MPLYNLTRPATQRLPIVLSIPHAGTEFPADVEAQLKPSLLPPDDTDWFVTHLYDFANELEIPVISARPSRWVIDLNRNPDDTPLYRDGRVITGLCTATTFQGDPIYHDERAVVDATEVARRRTAYFDPYHAALQELLDDTRARFGQVLLWDCHSIRRRVPAITPEPFPDLILGSADGTSAAPGLIELARQHLGSGPYQLSYNHPFKGGYITRHYGQPTRQQHALQLEMSKVLYLDDSETAYEKERADQVRSVLRQTLTALGQALLSSSLPA